LMRVLGLPLKISPEIEVGRRRIRTQTPVASIVRKEFLNSSIVTLVPQMMSMYHVGCLRNEVCSTGAQA
jgi:hypothetical protein